MFSADTNKNAPRKEEEKTYDEEFDIDPAVLETTDTKDVDPNEKSMRLSREEIQEFKIAFSMCTEAELQDSLHKDMLGELFMTLGYSLAPHNIQRLLVDYPPDSDGFISLEILLEAYDHWKNEDLKTHDDLQTVFNMIVCPIPDVTDMQDLDFEGDGGGGGIGGGGGRMIMSDMSLLLDDKENNVIDKATMKALLRQVDSEGDGGINYSDFARMMRLN
eukprot:gene4990-9970_t